FSGTSVDRVEFDGVAAMDVHTNRGAVSAEKVLAALGRAAAVDGMCLENAGVHLDDRGYIAVDEHLCAAPGIYAAGDVIGPPALASTSMEQGRRAARHALGMAASDGFDVIPVGVYTIPELAGAGLTEEAARAQFGDVLVGRAKYSELARSMIKGNHDDGFLKIIADPNGERILGVHCAGDSAAELVHVGQLAMIGGLTVEDLIDHVFNFPTMAEAFRVAALDVLGARDRRAQHALAVAAHP
ncbi:MAG TPA: FAD-dependent oxidoreductase, partial [Myxococcota bacterium]